MSNDCKHFLKEAQDFLVQYVQKNEGKKAHSSAAESVTWSQPNSAAYIDIYIVDKREIK